MTDRTNDQLGEVADFDAFFAEQAEPEPRGVELKLYGHTYTLPGSLPALFTLQLHRMQHSADPDDIRRLLTFLFGPEAVDQWTERGMTDRQLGIVLLWSMANVAKPGSVSMERAAQLYDDREAAKALGKAQQPRPKGKKSKRPRNSGKRS